MTALRESTLQKEGPLLVSKNVKIPFLLDPEEMKTLFEVLLESFPHLVLAKAQGVCKKGEEFLSVETFLDVYREYVELLKNGQAPLEERFRSFFSLLMSLNVDCLYAIAVDGGVLIKAARPILQLQPHHLNYSEQDGEFRSLLYGKETISWGLIATYPTLFQDSKTHEAMSIKEGPLFPNTALFRFLQRWMRSNTLPTPFRVGEKRVNVPVRLGKGAFSWIGAHPTLHAKGIKVDVLS